MTAADDVRCPRCQGNVAPGRGTTWPEGILCHRCYQQATGRHGRCPRCLVDRLLPGLSPTGAPICSDCAALGIDFHCQRCAAEAASYRHVLCPRCCLGDDLGVALDDGTDQINPALIPLYDAVTAQHNPVSGILWLRNPGVGDLLHQLATGTLPLAHHSFRNHPHPLMAIHLRDLLVTCGILPPIDRHTAAFEDWLAAHLPRYPPEAQQLLHGFATWHHLRRIRQLAAAGALTPGTIRTAKQEITVAAQLLTHLHTNGIAAGTAAQADLDAWLASGPSTRYTARTFVRWAVATRRLPALTFPHRQTRSSATLDQQQRLRLLNSCFQQATAPVAHRVAGILLLLYAQPVTRISRLRTADINDTGNDMVITFDIDAVPVPPPIAELLRQHLGDRPNMQTAANPTSPWLFPGLRAGQPLTADRMNHQLRNLGIPLRQARNSALRQLVQDMPPAVAARTLGYSQHVTQHHAEQAAVFFNSYATVHRRIQNAP